MKKSRFLLYTITLSMVAAAGCGGDDTTIGSTSSGSSSGSGGSAGGEVGGAGGMGGGMVSTGGMGGAGGSSSGMGGTGGGMGGAGGGMGGAGGMGGSGGAGGGMGGAGGGGGGPSCNPEGPFDGTVISAPANTWTWVPFPEAKCRNGSTTGIGVRINPNSTKLVIYLEGGGACFNGTTCLANPASYGSGDFGNGPSGGIFDKNNAANPVKDWSFVYVPYCTGDVHIGNNLDGDVPGALAPKNQQFVGYANIGHYLKRVVPTFANATEVLLTGVSAGGFGAFYNYDRVAQAFCPTPVALIDDSGPPMSDTYMAPCLQQRWRSLFNVAATLPADCVGCSQPDGGGLVNAWTMLANKYPTADLGLVSSTRDSTIRQFYGFGLNNCASIDGFAGSMSEAQYTAGLNEVRNMYLMPSAAWSTFFINATTHTFLGGGGFYSTNVGGTALTTFTAGIVDGAAAVHIGP